MGESSSLKPKCSTQYIYSEGGWEPLARVDSTGKYSEIFWYHTELNGLPERMTDHRGDVIWRGRFSLWGETEYENSGVSLNVPQNLRFQGQYLDRESGLHYNLFRYYDPAGSRFTQSDPIGLAGGLNTYAYVGDPLTWVDPLGLSRCKPGTASGRGSNIEGKWLKGTHGNAGLFPSSVADKLRGRKFKSFDDFRENVWKEVGNDPHLSQQFSRANITRMKSGRAPIAHDTQWTGKNKSYVLHHRTPIQHGGGVYNIIILTPRYHLDVSDRAYHF